MRLSGAVETAARALREALRKKGGRRMLDPGQEAPDFEVETHRGERVRLSAQRGKTIVLWFYPKADTPG
jgi:peroxiredoxin